MASWRHCGLVVLGLFIYTLRKSSGLGVILGPLRSVMAPLAGGIRRITRVMLRVTLPVKSRRLVFQEILLSVARRRGALSERSQAGCRAPLRAAVRLPSRHAFANHASHLAHSFHGENRRQAAPRILTTWAGHEWAHLRCRQQYLLPPESLDDVIFHAYDGEELPSGRLA